MYDQFNNRISTHLNPVSDKLRWLSIDAFDQAISQMVDSCEDTKHDARIRSQKNVIDPFQSIIVASTFGIKSKKELDNLQDINSTLRGLSSAVGNFHQVILSNIDGWTNHDRGDDLECNHDQIIAEIKNKHNTMNASNRQKVLDDLKVAIKQRKRGWIAYLVIIIPKKPVRYKKEISNNVYEIDGASFYKIATGFPNAIHELFDALLNRLELRPELVDYCQDVLNQSLPPRE